MIPYNLALLVAMPLIIPFLFWRFVTGKETAESLRQKFGAYLFENRPTGGIWIHAVSVGETNAAVPLVEMLAQRQNRPIIFSVSTQTGMKVAQARLAGKAFCVYFPFDFPFAVARALVFFTPAAVIFMETEIWPNFMRHARRRGVKTVLINGRISDRSFGNYHRMKRFLGPVLRDFDLLLMQSTADAGRVTALGADPGAVRVGGNIKFDRPLPDLSRKPAIAAEFGLPENIPAVIFASTHPGEDALFCRVTKELIAEGISFFPVIVPRHTERAQKVAALCREAGFAPRLRTEKETGGRLLILDTIGELARLYGGAAIAVMGGSFIPHGGQNPLEPAGWEVPVIFGPHMENFREISSLFLNAGVAASAADADALKNALRRWLQNPADARKAGARGRELLIQNSGALQKTAAAIDRLLQEGIDGRP